MFDWKIVVTVIIVMALAAGYVGTNPMVSGFFDGVSGKLSSLTGSSQSGIEFTFNADKYPNIEFSAKNPTNITVIGATTATLKSGTFSTKSMSIYNFTGSGSIKGNELILNGKIGKIELPEITVAVQETISSNSTFTSMSADYLTAKDITVKGTTGTLTARGATTQFSGDITITSPSGRFEFYKNSVVFTLSGSASKIAIPNAGINIG
ncbi:MAG TPA: hypothetical protein VJB05_00865 [archaeon]|nr:hypothetical protein [archaeon]